MAKKIAKKKPKAKSLAPFVESAKEVNDTYLAFMNDKRYYKKLKIQADNAEDRMNESEKAFIDSMERHNTNSRRFKK